MWLTKNLQVSFRVCQENFRRATLPPSYWEVSSLHAVFIVCVWCMLAPCLGVTMFFGVACLPCVWGFLCVFGWYVVCFVEEDGRHGEPRVAARRILSCKFTWCGLQCGCSVFIVFL